MSAATRLQSGVVDSLPVFKHHHLQFDFKTQQGRLRCYWYGRFKWVRPGQHWRLLIDETRWQDLIIPYGFSFGKYLKEKGYRCSCSVKASKQNKLIDESFWRDPIDAVRYRVRWNLDHYIWHYPTRGLMLALTLGDRSKLKQSDWQVFRATGTSHLVAISGLHIGLVALVTYFIVRLMLSLSYWLAELCWVPIISSVMSLLAASAYSFLAGFSVPTTRALIMILFAIAANLAGLRFNYYLGLGVAWLLLLLFDFDGLYFAGTWLSFAAVFILIYGYRQYQPKHWLVKIIFPQALVFIGLLPLTLYWFSQVSIISLLANIIAIPVMSFIIVPILLLAMCLMPIPVIAHTLFALANWALIGFWWFLAHLAVVPFAYITIKRPSLVMVILSMVLVLMIFNRHLIRLCKRLLARCA